MHTHRAAAQHGVMALDSDMDTSILFTLGCGSPGTVLRSGRRGRR